MNNKNDVKRVLISYLFDKIKNFILNKLKNKNKDKK